ncbi:MAG: hypothetical protein QM820_41340 [Minicystis sp.]
MAGAFRDELEAARSRAEGLREENEELREEVARLRKHEAEKAAGAQEPAADRNEDPELARLAEQTLERLEHLTEDEGGAPLPAPAETMDAVSGADLVQHPASEVHPPRPREGSGAAKAPTWPARSDDETEQDPALAREHAARTMQMQREALAELRGDMRVLKRRLAGYVAVTFFAGVSVGIAIGLVLR